MKVTVRYMAQLRQAAGVVTQEIELNGDAKPADLLCRLADRHGGALRRLLLTADGKPQPTLLVFVGDDQADVANTTLRDGNEVTLLSPIAGG
jgi:molybdopterin converting factor small subunit